MSTLKGFSVSALWFAGERLHPTRDFAHRARPLRVRDGVQSRSRTRATRTKGLAGRAPADRRTASTNGIESEDGSVPFLVGDTDGSAAGCVPKTCAQLKAHCGPQSNGCNGVVQCGDCVAPETCGGSGVPNVCGSGGAVADAGGIPSGPLTISPTNAKIVVPLGQHGSPITYTTAVGAVSVAASFSVDLGQVAVIDPSTGVLAATGTVGGVAHVSARRSAGRRSPRPSPSSSPTPTTARRRRRARAPEDSAA